MFKLIRNFASSTHDVELWDPDFHPSISKIPGNSFGGGYALRMCNMFSSSELKLTVVYRQKKEANTNGHIL